MRVPVGVVNLCRTAVMAPSVDEEASIEDGLHLRCPVIPRAATCHIKRGEAAVNITCANVGPVGDAEEAEPVDKG